MRHRCLLSVATGIALAVLSTEPANAQPREGRAHFGPWYPYPYPFGFAQVGFYPNEPYANLRLRVLPREAAVFVDGYAAGIVDDYDGVFQRLKLIPGHREVVIYLDGYRTLRQNLYVAPESSHTIKHMLEPLLPGEAPEPKPAPRPVTQAILPPVVQVAPVTGVPLPPSAIAAGRMGTLSIRVQPAGTSVFVDGELWRGPQASDRLNIQLAEGPHRLRVEKEGYQFFAVDVEVHAGETASFNVSLVQ